MEIKIGCLYPELLNLFGDKGNIISLKKRCEWRKIDAEVINITLDAKIDLENIDILYIGGGSERDNLTACLNLFPYRENLKKYIEDEKVLFSVCGGYEMLGEYFYIGDEKKNGLSLLPIYTKKGKKRFSDDTVTDTFLGKVCGYENHVGKTYINDLKPFGKVIRGGGNNGEDGTEGIIYKNTIGTYIHGPILPKNPEVTDYLIRKALEKKYNKKIELSLLNDSVEIFAKNYIIKRNNKTK